MIHALLYLHRLLADIRRMLALAWPALVGQLSVVAFATIDTVLVGHQTPDDLAAFAIGSAMYMTIVIALVGVVQSIGPIAGQLFGAGHLERAGAQLRQALWLALALSIPGGLMLAHPWPLLALSDATTAVQAKTAAYLGALALAVLPLLLFTAFRTFSTAVSRPRPVMLMQLAGLAAKLPLAVVLVQGHAGLGLPALGVWGCAISSAAALWLQVGLAWLALRRDPDLRRFARTGKGLPWPELASLRALLVLGLPIGGSLLIGISGFTLMAIVMARMGTAAVAAHQVAINLVSLLFMVPLALAQACSALVAQHVGAGDPAAARRMGWHGLALAVLLAAALGSAVHALRQPLIALYTRDAAVTAIATSLLAWVVWFHVADAAQALASFVLRAWKIATMPMLFYVAALWGIGLGGGSVLGFDLLGITPPALRGAPGYWVAATAGLVIAAAAMCALLAWATRRERTASQPHGVHRLADAGLHPLLDEDRVPQQEHQRRP